MRSKKGFTLIELLAVIIILAIIAVIATVIIMSTIDDAKQGAAERSVENYLKAVETGIMQKRIREKYEVENGTYTINADGEVCLDSECTEKIIVDMKGTIPSGGSLVILDGKVQAEGTSLIIGDYEATIGTDGSVIAAKIEESNRVYKPQYYGFITTGSLVGSEAPTGLSSVAPSDKDVYLGFDVDNSVVTAAYVCAVYDGQEYCLKGKEFGLEQSNLAILEGIVSPGFALNDYGYVQAWRTGNCRVEDSGFFVCES